MKKFTICLFAIVMTVPLFAKTYSLQEAISEVGKTFTKKLDGKVSTLAVMDIQTEYAELSDYICSELTHEFVISFEKTSVVERNASALQTIRKELNYQHSGEVSDATIQSVGNSLGADCVVIGKLESASKGFQLALKAVHIETKKILVSWKGVVDKDDKNIQLHTKKLAESEKKEIKRTVKLIDPKIEKMNFKFVDAPLKKVVSMFNSNLTYNDIADVFSQRLYKSSPFFVRYGLESTDELQKRKGEYAWGVYETDNKAYTMLVTNFGWFLLEDSFTNETYYESGEFLGVHLSKFLFAAALNLKSVGKSFSFDELEALNNVLLEFQNSIHNKDLPSGTTLKSFASNAYYRSEGFEISSKTFIEMCVKVGFDKYPDGISFLWLPSTMHDIDFTRFMLELGLDVNEPVDDESGDTALINSLFYPEEESKVYVDYLIKNGANVNIKNVDGDTALITAVKFKASEEILRLLIKAGANANDKDSDGHTAVWYAREEKNKKAEEILIKAGSK